MRLVSRVLAVLCLVCLSAAFNSEEDKLYDLVEEIGLNTTFYDILGVEKTASLAQIKSAFRKVSLQYHPDKNKASDAEQQFQRLASIMEFLRDPAMREQYDLILENGLPTWRQPVFYVRTVKKLGVGLAMAILVIGLSFAQYLLSWTSYLEKKSSLTKKIRKKKKGIAQPDPTPESDFPMPSLFDLLVWRLPMVHVPTLCLMLVQGCRNIISPPPPPEEEAVAPRYQLPPREVVAVEFERADFQPVPSVEASVTEEPSAPTTTGGQGPWTADEIVLLQKALVRFPGGTGRRWLRVSEFVGRDEKQCINTAKMLDVRAKNAMKGQAVQSSSIETEPKVVETTTAVANTATSDTPSSLAAEAAALGWSPSEQSRLEKALVQFPSSPEQPAAERWQKIAKFVGRPRSECVARYKCLASLAKAKKEA